MGLRTDPSSCADGNSNSQGGAGFFEESSQAGGGGGGVRAENSTSAIRPVTIKQMLDSQLADPNDEVLLCDYKPLKHVRFVGVIRGINARSTGTRFRLEDGTGMVEAQMFASGPGGGGGGGMPGGEDGAGGEDDMQDELGDPRVRQLEPRLEENMYVSVFARLSWKYQRHSLSIVDIQPVTDFNEVAYHLLNAVHAHVANTGGLAGSHSGAAAAAAPSSSASLFVGGDVGGRAGGSGGAGLEGRIMEYLGRSTANDDVGVHIQQIASDLGIDVNRAEAALDTLQGEGRVYVPDEGHFMITPE